MNKPLFPISVEIPPPLLQIFDCLLMINAIHEHHSGHYEVSQDGKVFRSSRFGNNHRLVVETNSETMVTALSME